LVKYLRSDLSRTDLSAPFCSNHSTQADLLLAAAKCSGVQPFSSTAILDSVVLATNGSKSVYLQAISFIEQCLLGSHICTHPCLHTQCDGNAPVESDVVSNLFEVNDCYRQIQNTYSLECCIISSKSSLLSLRHAK